MHDFFYSHINWTTEEDKKNRIGFFIDTFELSKNDRCGFKVCANWKLLKALNSTFKISKQISKKNQKVYKTAKLMLAINVKQLKHSDFIECGRLLQKIWLRANEMGLSMQPLTGILFLRLRFINDSKIEFDSTSKSKIMSHYARIEKLFNFEGGHISMLMRVGYADVPSAHALRLDLSEFIKK